MKKRILSLLLAVAVLTTLLPAALASGVYTDTDGHWGETSIDRWTGYGVVGGYGDEFQPNGEMSRAELARVLVNLLGLQQTASVSQYQDVAPGDWFYDDIAKCVAAGILNGVGNSMQPNRKVTREEMFTMFARALGIAPKASSSAVFADSGEVSSWAAGYINALADMGIVSGMGGGKLAPGANINRASVMTVLDKAISDYANTNGVTVGSSTGIVLVVADQVTVSGNVENLVVAGSNNTVTLSGGTSAAVAVVGQNTTVNVSANAAAGKVVIDAKATGSTVNVAKGATVGTVDSKADGVTIAGEGKVETALVSGSNTAVNTDGTDLTVAPGTVGVTENSKPVSGGTTVETEPGKGQTTKPVNPVTPPTVIPTFYTVTFVDVNGQAIVSPTSVQAGYTVTAPEIELAEGEKVTWYRGAEPVDLSKLTVGGDMTLTAVVGSDLFAAGNGTQAYPYLISNAEQFAAIKDLEEEMLAGTSFCFKQIADITGLTGGVEYLRGVYDGGGYKMCAITGNYKGVLILFRFTLGNTTIKNINTYSTGTVGVTITYMACTGVDLTIEGCTANVDAVDNTLRLENVGNFGFMIYYSIYDAKADSTDSYNVALDSEKAAKQTVTLENCTVNGSVQNTGNCTAAFIGQGFFPLDGNGSKLIMRNCVNNGNITSNLSAGLITGNLSYDIDANKMITSDMDEAAKIAAFSQYYEISNVTNNGNIQSTTHPADFIAADSANGEIWVNTYIGTLVTNNGTIGAKTNSIENKDLKLYSDGTTFYVNDSSYAYKVAFKVNAIYIEEGVSNSRDVLIWLDTYADGQTTASLVNTTKVHAYDAQAAVTNQILTEDEVNGLTYPYLCEIYRVDIVEKDGNTYIIFANDYDDISVNSGVETYIYGYNNRTDLEYVGSKRINQTNP